MSIRKIWLIIVMMVVIASISINAFLMTILTDRHFDDYLLDSYEQHVDQIMKYVESTMTSREEAIGQMASELETHLQDPIIEIRIYDAKGDLLLKVDTDQYMMPRNRMMGNFGKRNTGETQSYEIRDQGSLIATVNVETHTTVGNTFGAQAFKSSLWLNTGISMVIALLLSIVLGSFVSKKMSRSLKETASFAQELQLGESGTYKQSKILEIDQIRKSLEGLNLKLQLKRKSRKALVDELVHQTRTPLTILKTHTEALEDGVIEPDASEMKVFHHQIENLTAIISNVSRMIDAEKEKIQVNKERVDVHGLIRQVAAGLKPQYDSKEIDLTLELSDKRMFLTDPYLLSQVIYNLLTNTLKYTPKGGKTKIKTTWHDSHFQILVSDTGIGILPEDLPRIFEAYYRSKDVIQTNGDGIGLYVVRENLELLGGTISVNSSPGKGSQFVIDFFLTH